MVEKYYIVESDGIKREAIYIKCTNCGKVVLRAKRHIKRSLKRGCSLYCSLKCVREFSKKNSKIEIECGYCKKKFKIYKSRLGRNKSGLHFCSKGCKDLAQRIDSGVEGIHPSHYCGHSGYRKRALNKYGRVCEVCGYNGIEEILEVHHIDGNRRNGDLSNLIVLCPICHKILTLGIGILKGRKLEMVV